MSGWVYVGGTFDLFHYGHARFLEECAKHGKVIVAINTDDFCKRYKRKPVLTLGERIESVRSCKWVADVIVNVGDEDTGLTIDLVKDKTISYIAHGDDWMGPALMAQLGITQQWLDSRGIKMLYIPYTKGISTSEIIRRVGGNIHGSSNGASRLVGDASDNRLTDVPEEKAR